MRLANRPAVALAVLVSFFACSLGSAQQLTTFVPSPDPPEFIAFIQPDPRVALARDQVIKILSSDNSCSLWFQRIDPNPAGTFASLKFTLDAKGPQYVIGSPSPSGEMLYKHPYSARAFENSGRGAVVVLNPNGPFFVRVAPVLQRDIPGGAPRHAGWRTLQVGVYLGNSPGAQITTLLHELGHVVGRIPPDPDTFGGQSERNTAEVLHFCRAQISAADHILRRLEF